VKNLPRVVYLIAPTVLRGRARPTAPRWPHRLRHM